MAKVLVQLPQGGVIVRVNDTGAAAHAAAAAASADAAAQSALSADADREQTGVDRAAVESARTAAEGAAVDAVAAADAAQTALAGADGAETNAVAAKTAAENAQSAAELVYDNFDNRYLGAKVADPALDNDGNALIAGALYFNPTIPAMKVWTGSAWSVAYAEIGSALVTFESLYANGDVGAGADQLAVGNHNHAGVYEPVDVEILRADTADDLAAGFGITPSQAAAASAFSPDFQARNIFTWNYAGNKTLNSPTNLRAGAWKIYIAATTGTLTLNSIYKVVAGTYTAGKVNVLTLDCDGISVYVTIGTEP